MLLSLSAYAICTSVHTYCMFQLKENIMYTFLMRFRLVINPKCICISSRLTVVPRTSGSQACGRVTLALHAYLALLALEGACGRVAPPEGGYPYCWPGVPGVVGSSRAPGPAVVCPLTSGVLALPLVACGGILVVPLDPMLGSRVLLNST